MSENSEETKKNAKEQSEKLAKLGMSISEIQFSYKVNEKTSKEYWSKRIELFKKYSKCSLQYYNQAYSLMNLVNKQESQMFLLRISKFRQLASELNELMEKIKENPSIINSKDKQQSMWSKEIRQQIVDHSSKCVRHEKNTNTSFREFYEKHLRGILG